MSVNRIRHISSLLFLIFLFFLITSKNSVADQYKNFPQCVANNLKIKLGDKLSAIELKAIRETCASFFIRRLTDEIDTQKIVNARMNTSARITFFNKTDLFITSLCINFKEGEFKDFNTCGYVIGLNSYDIAVEPYTNGVIFFPELPIQISNIKNVSWYLTDIFGF